MAGTLYQTPLQTFIDFIKVIVAALFIAMLIRTFVLQPYYIPSESMLNTLQKGDWLFVSKFSYGLHLPFVEKEIVSFGEPQRGDIIVFPAPEDKSKDFIKRVIGVPGDVVEMRSKQLYLNNEPVKESYVIHQDPGISLIRDNMRPVTVPPGKVLVLGDNRDNSQDSRVWGMVDKDTIHGKAQIIYWSSKGFPDVQWSRIGMLLR